MASNWRTVRLFLSSTFRDMHAERDHLVKKVFPGLRERLLPYRVELADIDLRWGITEEEARSEQVVGLCLDQVRECRPFFLAFLGHRYGWVPGRLTDDTLRRFPEVANLSGQGVTDLEIRVGALLEPAGKRALFCLRDGAALETIPEATRRRDYLEPDAVGAARLETLKAELRSGPFSVTTYPAAWRADLWDRVNRSPGKLDGLDAFGKTVEAWLWEAIVAELGLPAEPPNVAPLEAERDLHERFAESRLRIYIGREDVYQRLRDYARSEATMPALVTGESGLGKSSALARFVRDFRREHPDVLILSHFVGASPWTTALPTMLRRLCQEMKAAFDFAMPIPDDEDEIPRTFNAFLASIPEDRRVVFVFDALNQLDADRRAESLAWLPEELPPHVKVIASCVTGPQRPPRVLSAFGERVYLDVPMPPLTDAERREIVRAVPKVVAKTLDDRQVDALLANPATRNPLYLMVALEELRGSGSFERLGELIASFPRDGDATTRLFMSVFERLEDEFRPALVRRVLTLLACARKGLSDRELEALVADLGDDADELFPLLKHVGAYLLSRDGLYDFYHLSMRRAVETKYLGWERDEDQNDPFERWSRMTPDGLRESSASDPTEPERAARQRLIAHFDADRLSPRAIEELPWQRAQVRDWQGLNDLLANLAFLRVAWRSRQVEVREYWSLLQGLGKLRMLDAYREAMSMSSYRSGMWELAHLLMESGHPQESGQIWPVLAQHFRQIGEEGRTSDCLGNQALILRATGDLDGAMRLHQEVEATCRRLNDPDGLSTCLGNQAVILHATGDLAGAMRLLQEKEAICRRLNDSAGLSRSLGNQAVILKDTGDLAGAMRLLQEQEAICRRLNDPAGLSSCLGNQALTLRDTGDRAGAMRLHQEEEAICRRLNDPDGLSRSLGNQALILKDTGDLVGAMRLHQEEEMICRRLNNPGGLYACLGNQAVILRDTGDRVEAMRLLKEVEAICRRLKDPAGLSRSLGNQALILMETGDLDGAMRLLKEVEAICRRLNDPNGLTLSLLNQASLLTFKLHRPVDGLPLAEEAYRLAKQHGLAALARQIQPFLERIRQAAG